MNRQSVFFSFSGFQCKLQFAAQQLRKAIESSVSQHRIDPRQIIEIQGQVVEEQEDAPTLYSWIRPHRIRDYTEDGRLYRVDLTRPSTIKKFQGLGRQAAAQMQANVPTLDQVDRVVIFCYSQGALVAMESVKRLFWDKKHGWTKEILVFSFAGTTALPPSRLKSYASKPLPPACVGQVGLTIVNFFDPRDEIIPPWHHDRTTREWSATGTKVINCPSEIATAKPPFHGMYVPHVEHALVMLAGWGYRRWRPKLLAG
jgi:hypothetical protein